YWYATPIFERKVYAYRYVNLIYNLQIWKILMDGYAFSTNDDSYSERRIRTLYNAHFESTMMDFPQFQTSSQQYVSTFNNKIIIKPFEEIYPRLDILDFTQNETYRPQLDLLIQSYQALFDKPYGDMRSFYQIGGIHGLPYTAYDGVIGDHGYKSSELDEGRWGGYCQHGNILFPPWHRPYLLLMESQLVSEAKEIALKYPENERQIYVEAAKQLRHPYWDWADEKAIKGIPEIFISPEIEINSPDGKKKIKNPLKSYTLPVDLSYPLEKGQNPTDKPNYKIPNMTYNPFTPAGYSTIRHPNSNYEDQYDIMNINISTYVPSVFRPGLYQMFHINDYLHFSNHGLTSSGTQMADSNPGHPDPAKIVGYAHFASIETTHDGFHIIIGGLGGHMAYPDITGFDPLFYFHHLNVDRIFALWQGVFPDSWVPSNININGTYTELMNTTVDGNSDLTPFRKSDTAFWTSNDVRYIEKLGYTYPELAKFKGKDPKELQSYLLELYKPDPHYGRRFFAKLTIESGKLIGPYSVRVFVDLASANADTPVTSPHFAGFVAMWRSTNNHQANNNSYIVGSVDITAAMERLGIRMQKHDYVQDVNATTGLLMSTSIFNVETDINIVPVSLDGKGISLKDAGVNKVEVFSFQHDEVNANFLVESS
ncbi:3142_t:CDS:2, partial [Cetraspora pellucida]